MSLFQCSKCGCVDNTSCSRGGSLLDHFAKWASDEVLESWRKLLELKPGEPLGKYCCVCNPAWYQPCTCGHAPHLAGHGCHDYGIGPNPDSLGWHNRFPREFYKKNSLITNHEGNIVPKYAVKLASLRLDREEGT